MTPACSTPTVALIHATPAAMDPARAAFADRFPTARLWNLLDDQLITQANEAGGITEPLRQRMLTLIDHAIGGGADAVLLTCSMYGATAQSVADDKPVPVLAPDQALFDRVAQQVTEQHAERIAVLGPVPTGVADTVQRLTDHLAAHGTHPTITGTVVPEVVPAAAAHDDAALVAAVVVAARRVQPGTDLIVLGNFSLAPATAAVADAVDVPVLSPPHLAADALRARLQDRSAA